MCFNFNAVKHQLVLTVKENTSGIYFYMNGKKH